MGKINVTRSSMPDFEEYVDEIKDIWESRWLSNGGMKHQQLERELLKFFGVENLALFANGHLALEVAVSGFGFPYGAEVITTPYTHVSTTHSIVKNGLKPVFCDIREEDLTINPGEIEKLITDQTVAIVATHVYGFPCAVQEIAKIADKYQLKVIYDAAHAFGVTIDGKNIVTYGDAAMISFHATKVFHTIEGGVTVFKDPEILDKVNYMINFGYTSQETIDYIGTNARMNEFEAAMGVCNLRYIREEIKKRKKVAERYYENLETVLGIRVLKPKKNVEHNYAYFPVVIDGKNIDRNRVAENLAKHNIFARKYFYPAVNKAGCYKKIYDAKETPVSTYYSEHILSLPMYSDLELKDVDTICSYILEY